MPDCQSGRCRVAVPNRSVVVGGLCVKYPRVAVVEWFRHVRHIAFNSVPHSDDREALPLPPLHSKLSFSVNNNDMDDSTTKSFPSHKWLDGLTLPS
jgi:hypothetical protein